MIYLIVIIGIVVIIAVMANMGNVESPSANKPKTIDIDVPNPTVASPEKFLDFIEKTPADYLWQVEKQLGDSGLLKDIVLAKAIREKTAGKSFDKNKFLKIIAKIQEGNYTVDESEIPSDFKFCSCINIAGTFIPDRKEYIIFDLNEGDELILKPEPYNPHDQNAIAVFHNSKIIGYVPAVDCLDVKEMIKYKYFLKVADIIYKNDFIDVVAYLYKNESESSEPAHYLSQDAIKDVRSRKINSEFLRPKKDAEDINAFYKKKVVITGNFNNFPDRNDLAKLLYDSGADIDTCITERTSYIIAGEGAGWKKMDKAKEYDITVFNEKQILKIFDLIK